jgi:intracellular sulfur oxidation DsrE/DsrF family protein
MTRLSTPEFAFIRAARALLLVCCCYSGALYAEVMLAAGDSENLYLARIQVHTSAELAGILKRADVLFSAEQLDTSEPIVFVLHGGEGRAFLRQSYASNKDLVDLAAKLSALEVVDIRVCETWMGGQRIDASELQPFVDTVPYGPAEIKRLRGEQNYIYF